MTVSSYHERALASTDSRCETGGCSPFFLRPGLFQVLTWTPWNPLLFLVLPVFTFAAFWHRVLAPAVYSPFGLPLVQALTCECLAWHTCRLGAGSLDLVVRLRPAILRSSHGAPCLSPALVAFCHLAFGAGCVVGCPGCHLLVVDVTVQEGVAVIKPRK